VSSNVIYNFLNKTEVLGIGSIISGDLSNYAIWGSGIMWENIKINKPKEVLALRGLKTLKKIQEVGGNCDVFGDPVLLFPEIFSSQNIEKNTNTGLFLTLKTKTKLGFKRLST